ncbi:MAG TPA: cytochrome P450 [Roseiflexaceae bacterium]|nr:cytochrome P450 [Roseiflexaceae bacterium]
MLASFLPGPQRIPLIGRSGQLLSHFRDPVRSVSRRYAQFGPVSALVAGDPWWVFALGTDFNHQILTDTKLFHSVVFFLPASDDSSLRRLFGGLLNMNGEQHHRHRKLMLPAFQRQSLSGYVPLMLDALLPILDRWSPGRQIDIVSEMRKITFAIVIRSLFGIDNTEDEQYIAEKLHQVLALYTSSTVQQLPLNIPGMPYRKLLRKSDELDATLRQIIDEKRSHNSNDHNVMQMLLRARDDHGALTEDELIGHIFLLFLAGHETSATALAWTLLLLEQHPHILADLHDEISVALGGNVPNIDVLDRLPLLERVIKESLRIIPPVVGFGRYATQECNIGDYILPKDSYVSISPYITHRLPEIYPNPYQFTPDRWMSIRPSPYEYLPFGAGPRLCLGAAFAMLEIKIVLSVIIQRFRLQIRSGALVNRRWRATLAPAPGLPAVVYAQDRQFTSTPIRGSIHEMVQLSEV